jgi:hypothetical protein
MCRLQISALNERAIEAPFNSAYLKAKLTVNITGKVLGSC